MSEDGVDIGPVEAIRFLVELATLASVGFWGYYRPVDPLPGLVSAVGFVLLVAGAWGVLASPKAPYRLQPPVRQGFEVLVFGAGVLALVDLGRVSLAGGMALFAAVAIVGTALRESS